MLSGRLLSYLKKRKISRNGHSLSFVVTRCTTRCHSLYHSLSLVVPLVVIRCHSLSFVVTRCTTRCHSLSFVVTRCTTRLSFHKRSPPKVFCKKGVLRNFAKFTGKHLYQSLYFNKVAGLFLLK